ncbi:hypothetical protein [Helicobacter pylori]|uniref:hypothetical protein n=1 Tax=Helicobacter pylori TaxID=210 RepID=UPI002739C0E4|nr:hypothetical protein [Helicobacter pylori]
MRQRYETATSFNQLKEITQAIQAQKVHEQTSANANASEPTQEHGNKPKGAERAKNHALNPTKKAFSERKKTAFRDRSQATDHARFKAIQKQGSNANANALPSDKATQHGLKSNQENQKGGE